MARGKRPVPFRTRKLSLSAPMVLPWRRGGRVGRRRTTIPEGAPASVLGPLRHAQTPVAVGAAGRRPGTCCRLPSRTKVARHRSLRRGPFVSVEDRSSRGREEGPMTTQAPLAIEATGLEKSFGDTHAVAGVDLAVPEGAIYGVLGPNGAGKTTVIRMLATLIAPDAGTARVLGHDIRVEGDAVRGLVSLTGQLASVDEELTGRENLVLLGRLLGLARGAAKARADELLEAFGIAEASGRLVKHYSGGMRRRLDIAASIVVTPRVMFLDEPTTGLDPRSRNQVWEIARALVAGGTTILLCTQYLEEADQLADGIAVIDRGRVIAEGTPGHLKASVGTGSLHVRLLEPGRRGDAAGVLERTVGPVVLQPDPAAVSVSCADAGRAASGVAELSAAGIGIAEFSLGQPSLDEVFLALTGHAAEEHASTLEEQAS